VLHYDLKKDAINEFGIKYWTSNPVWELDVNKHTMCKLFIANSVFLKIFDFDLSSTKFYRCLNLITFYILLRHFQQYFSYIVEETGEPGVNHWPAASHLQILSQCCIEYTSPERDSNSQR
jgi:hypothetical protein